MGVQAVRVRPEAPFVSSSHLRLVLYAVAALPVLNIALSLLL